MRSAHIVLEYWLGLKPVFLPRAYDVPIDCFVITIPNLAVCWMIGQMVTATCRS
jgi:hypothetical protein